jgi:diacylglycerol kinase family enzyme
VSLISVGNNPLTGGLFRTVPDADPTDGLLSFVYGYAPSRWKMFDLLPRLISGKYIEDPDVHQHHTVKLEIRSLEPSPLQADGELRAEAENVFRYEIIPSKLDVLSPLK